MSDIGSYGPEVGLGDYDSEALTAQDMRDRLAIATLYLANWYRATDDSTNKAVWWTKIDSLRHKVENAYNELSKAANAYFPGRDAIAFYKDAANSWPQLWRDLTLDPEVNVHFDLLNSTAGYVETVFHTPGLLIPSIGNELGKIVGGTLGNFLRQTWPWLAAAGGIGLIYVFRGPLSKLANKVGS